MRYMKYLLLVFLGLLVFQVAHAQLPDDTTADLDLEAEQQQEEEQASGVGETFVEVEEEQASGVGETFVEVEEENEANPEEQQEAIEESGVFEEEAVEVDGGIFEALNPDEAAEEVEILQGIAEEEEGTPDASGNVNVTLTKWLSNTWNKQVVNFVFQWQLSMLEGLEIAPTYYAWGLDKVNFVSFNKQEGVYRVNLRANDVEISRDFWTGHSVITYSETPNKQFQILRTRWGYNSEIAADLNNETIANIVNSNWSTIDPTEAQQDPAFKALMDYGIDLALGIAQIRVLALFPGGWSLKSLDGVNIQAKNDGNIYHLSVTLSGPNGYTATGEVVVRKKPDGTNTFINYGIDGLFPPTA